MAERSPRFCLRCRATTYGADYCDEHAPRRKPYDTQAHRRAQREARAQTGEPCPVCGRRTGPGNPMQADHETPVLAGGADGPRRPRCRACNVAAGQ